MDKKRTKKYKFLVFCFSILIGISFINAIPIYLKPLTAYGGISPNSIFNYTFNFTLNNDCSGVIISNKSVITTNGQGLGFVDVNISGINTIPRYLCEYKYNILRKTHILSDQIFRDLYVNNIFSNNWTNVTVNESQIVDLSHIIDTWKTNYTNYYNLTYVYNKTQVDNNLSLRYLLTNPNNYINFTNLSSFGTNNFNGTGNFTTTGNITAGKFIGNGTLITGVCLANGTSCQVSGDTWKTNYTSYYNLTFVYNKTEVDNNFTKYIPYTGASQEIDLNGKSIKNIKNISVGGSVANAGIFRTNNGVIYLGDESNSRIFYINGTSSYDVAKFSSAGYNVTLAGETSGSAGIFTDGTSIVKLATSGYAGYFTGNVFISGGITASNLYPSSWNAKADYQFTTNNFNGSGNVTAGKFIGNGTLITGVCLANGSNCQASGSDTWKTNYTSYYNLTYVYNKTEVDNNLSLRYLASNPNNWNNITNPFDQSLNTTESAIFKSLGLQYSESINNSADDMIDFQGVGGSANVNLRIDLDDTDPTISSPSSDEIRFADSVYVEDTSQSSGYMIQLYKSNYDVSAGSKASAYFSPRVSTGGSGAMTALQMDARYTGTQAQTGAFRGFWGVINQYGTGLVSELTGVRGSVNLQDTNTNATNMYAINTGGLIAEGKISQATTYADIYAGGIDVNDGNITGNAYNFYGNAHASDSGLMTGDAWGIYLEKQTIGVNNYGIVLGGDSSNIGSDSGSAIIFGAGKDAGIYWDGTNLIFDYNRTAGNSNAVAWFSGNISSTSFDTRTSVYDKSKGNALDKIKDANDYKIGLTNEINHSIFYGYKTYQITDYSNCWNVIDKYCYEKTDSKYDEESDTTEYYTETFCVKEIKDIPKQIKDYETKYRKECGTKTEEGVSLNDEIDVLRQAVYELKVKNKELEDRLKVLEDKLK